MNNHAVISVCNIDIFLSFILWHQHKRATEDLGTCMVVFCVTLMKKRHPLRVRLYFITEEGATMSHLRSTVKKTGLLDLAKNNNKKQVTQLNAEFHMHYKSFLV